MTQAMKAPMCTTPIWFIGSRPLRTKSTVKRPSAPSAPMVGALPPNEERIKPNLTECKTLQAWRAKADESEAGLAQLITWVDNGQIEIDELYENLFTSTDRPVCLNGSMQIAKRHRRETWPSLPKRKSKPLSTAKRPWAQETSSQRQ